MKIKVDPLFVVLTGLLFAIYFVVQTFGLTFNETTFVVDPDLDLKKSLAFPDNSLISETSGIEVVDPRLNMLVSMNGGDTYSNYGKAVKLDQFENVPIDYVPTSIRWRHPAGDFPKLKSIIVQLENSEDQKKSEPQVYTYFDESLSTGKLISLSIKNSDLFDEMKGIMIYGASSWIDSGFYKGWWYRSANFSQRGAEWEREVNFQYFEKGDLKLNQNCGIRISGNATRYFPQKSLRLYARKTYGKEEFVYPFWDKSGTEKSTSLLLRNGGNDNTRTMFADLLMHRISRSTNVLVLEGFPVPVFINGNYWGVYELRERIDPKLIASKTDFKEDEITILDAPNGVLKDGDEKHQIEFNQLIEQLRKNLKSDTDSYDLISSSIDLGSFTDYIILEAFYANPDWPQNNCTWYRSKDSKWKWILYDMDLALSFRDGNLNSNIFEVLNQGETVTSVLYKSLIQNEIFKNDLKKRTDQLLETVLSEANIRAIFYALFNEYEPLMDLQIRRWRSIANLKQWKSDSLKNLEFLLERREVLKSQVSSLL